MLLAAATIFSSTSLVSASSITESPIKQYWTVDDFKEPGEADLSKLSPEDQEKMAKRDSVVGAYFLEGGIKRAKLNKLQQELVQAEQQLLNSPKQNKQQKCKFRN
ncbi:hypothetical protein EC604_03630 [Paenibacillus amylolyticus]|uniref:Uncharacterized protein n=1 Tax=Paenibacillus amylolyticus TaxID=1451 RepID=A0A5M9WMX8_PAEAM|nr:hypothetical protein EC604_03630 [Paenibacillus amylolyticus]